MVLQEAAGGHIGQTQPQTTTPLVVYTGTPFPSILQTGRGGGAGHYTPPPMLNPLRRSTGLLSSFSSLHHDERGMRAEDERYRSIPSINVGPGFQADLPDCFLEGVESDTWGAWSDESQWEELLWQPWAELAQSSDQQEKVEELLSVCSSSCLPGGGSNTELALHCLHLCQGDTLATLEMLLLYQISPTGDYHYCGSDEWSVMERGVFFRAIEMYGRDFSSVHCMVKTKSVCQCVEFYYLCKRLPEKQSRQREEERGMKEQMSMVLVPKPMAKQVGLVPAPPLADCFPCKQCGKVFYKIKSRNAHMKIHRQVQEDWGDRAQQHQHLLTQRLALNLAQNLTPTLANNLLQPQASAAYLPGPASNSHVVPNQISVTVGNATAPAPLLPLHQSWDSFEVTSDSATFYYNS